MQTKNVKNVKRNEIYFYFFMNKIFLSQLNLQNSIGICREQSDRANREKWMRLNDFCGTMNPISQTRASYPIKRKKKKQSKMVFKMSRF